jgi:hypothetical protein
MKIGFINGPRAVGGGGGQAEFPPFRGPLFIRQPLAHGQTALSRSGNADPPESNTIHSINVLLEPLRRVAWRLTPSNTYVALSPRLLLLARTPTCRSLASPSPNPTQPNSAQLSPTPPKPEDPRVTLLGPTLPGAPSGPIVEPDKSKMDHSILVDRFFYYALLSDAQ